MPPKRLQKSGTLELKTLTCFPDRSDYTVYSDNRLRHRRSGYETTQDKDG